MTVRALVAADLAAAGDLLHDAYAAAPPGARPPFGDASEGSGLAARCLAAEPDGALALGDGDGALAGVGFVRRRGDVATIGPLAVRARGRGGGGALLDELIAQAEGWGCAAVRLFQAASDPDAFALASTRRFSVIDVAACLLRAPGAPPRLDAARGLEIAPARGADLDEAIALDLRLTGLERREDLVDGVRLVARRRGNVVGYLAWRHGTSRAPALIGPAVALDAADLGALVARGLAELPEGAAARVSTAAPTAVLVLVALGFRVAALGTVMCRGVFPPARPPQIYAADPEVL